MTPQAENSLKVHKGGNPATIEALLRMQKASVVNELKAHFSVSNNHDLAIKLSMQ